MLNFKNSLSIADGGLPDDALRNFWGVEKGFVWSKGRWCEIAFGFDLAELNGTQLCDLILDIDVFRHEGRLDGQNLLIYLNGLRIGSLYCTQFCTVVFPFEASLLKADENILTIDTPDAESPSTLGKGDSRTLGLQLFSVQIRRVDCRL
ncbi:hypothetical protein [Rhodopseudomonas palustris]|uniref:hypothetical protein n=1 Tax=Rhodopseudomonas palustris TaxID=1076 RepID=UPI000E5C1187|nr:hypothetical protein [Rhodopseudomonas palustris]QLH71662.1 hypothetical protein HZF03_13035 [Rhodopseudomonas palustris]RIA02312.1 hypothetical protein D1920_08320 [Rhodopseudomonas palustris]